jgi:hypothetical protein
MLHQRKQLDEGKRQNVLTGYHLENWNAKADEQISYDRMALLCSCGHHGFHRSNHIEAMGNAK